MIGLVVAMEREAEKVIPLIENKIEKTIAGKKVIEGELFSKKIALIISGIGKVSSSLSCQLLIDKYNVEKVINFGSVGGVSNKVKVLEYYLVEKSCQFDFDLREIDPVPLGYNQDYDTVFYSHLTPDCGFNKVNLGSSDKFTSKKEIIDEVIEMGCDIRDMEGGAIAQVCTANSVPLIMLKGVTDVYGLGTDGEQFFNNLKSVSANFPEKLKTLFKEI